MGKFRNYGLVTLVLDDFTTWVFSEIFVPGLFLVGAVTGLAGSVMDLRAGNYFCRGGQIHRHLRSIRSLLPLAGRHKMIVDVLTIGIRTTRRLVRLNLYDDVTYDHGLLTRSTRLLVDLRALSRLLRTR